MYIAYRVNATDSTNERTPTGDRSTASGVALRARSALVYKLDNLWQYWLFDVQWVEQVVCVFVMPYF